MYTVCILCVSVDIRDGSQEEEEEDKNKNVGRVWEEWGE